MGAKQSEEMRKAKILIIENGYSVVEAALISRISFQAIYISKWYKQWKSKNKRRKNA